MMINKLFTTKNDFDKNNILLGKEKRIRKEGGDLARGLVYITRQNFFLGCS